MTCVLAIETATDLVGCAVADDTGVLAANALSEGKRHGELLAQLVEQTIGQSGAAPSDISLVAADIGPGLYTGLRVGVATAMALGHAWQVPTLGVASLEVLAFDFAEEMDGAAAGLVLPVLDARRSEFFFAAFRGCVDELLPPAVGDLAEMQRCWRQVSESVSDNLPRYIVGAVAAEMTGALGEVAESIGASVLSMQVSPEAVAKLALRKWADGSASEFSSEPLRPMYLRTPDIGPSAKTKSSRQPSNESN